MKRRESQKLSHRQRKATPLWFASMLLRRVRRVYGVQTVACLWVAPDSVYKGLRGTDCWDEDRDARRYAGPGPIIAHPPCGPWGKLAWSSRESKDDGARAMELVHRWGGVVEQPLGSQLFRLHGDERGVIEAVNQGDYGHAALKPTLLYWVLP